MKLRLASSLLLLALSLGFSSLTVQADLPDPSTKSKVPPIAFVQARIWQRLNLADFMLTGVIRTDKSKKSYPLILRTHSHELVYEFQDQPLQIRVQLNPGAFVVEKRTSSSGTWTTVSGSDMTKSILDTDITYEDLGIDFINWDNVEPLGIDTIKTLNAYVFDATPGANDHSHFSKVRFWVSSQYWAFLRIDGLNSKDQTIKRVEVQDVTQIGKYTIFKEMKVATMIPDRNDMASSTTFIDIKDGKEGSGLSQ